MSSSSPHHHLLLHPSFPSLFRFFSSFGGRSGIFFNTRPRRVFPQRPGGQRAAARANKAPQHRDQLGPLPPGQPASHPHTPETDFYQAAVAGGGGGESMGEVAGLGDAEA